MHHGNESERTRKKNQLAVVGTICFGIGVVVVIARTLEATIGIEGMPRSWYQNGWLWWLIGLSAIAAGSRFLFQAEPDESPDRGWQPSVPGRRFQKMVLYTRSGCHLCDEAVELIRTYRRWLPTMTLSDIDSDPNLVTQFGTCVPVLALDDKVRFRGKVNETLLRRLIEGTAPAGP